MIVCLNEKKMNVEEIEAKIRLKNTQIQAEADPNKKIEMNKQLRVLQVRKQLELIRLKNENSQYYD
jgi:hypothetical protein